MTSIRSFTIRPMTEGDLPAVLAAAAESPEAPRWQPTAFAPYLASDPNPLLRRAAFVAEPAADGSVPGVIGFAVATLVLANDKSDPENRCELDSVIVHPAARRRGAGAALLRNLLAWAIQHGARRLVLDVRASNARALRLYQRFGLRVEGRRPRYYADPEEDALLLGMPIT
jgi:[ribosomal protein S18]-alanine N-acetyltransferase